MPKRARRVLSRSASGAHPDSRVAIGLHACSPAAIAQADSRVATGVHCDSRAAIGCHVGAATGLHSDWPAATAVARPHLSVSVRFEQTFRVWPRHQSPGELPSWRTMNAVMADDQPRKETVC
jgi:hypothetical protein